MHILKLTSTTQHRVLSTAISALRRGLSVVFPTETSYGLAVDAVNARAVKRLFATKGRSFAKPVHVVVTGATMARQYIRWGRSAERLAVAFWPGALTIVSKAHKTSRIPKSALELLTAGSGNLGVRMPAHVIPLGLVFGLNRPVTATSANLSGTDDCYEAGAIANQFRRRRLKPDILIDAGTLPKQKPSTVVRIERTAIDCLRKGPITREDILQILSKGL